MTKKKKICLCLFLLHWIFLWASINTNPNEIYLFGQNFSKSINSMRILLALTSTALISLYFFFTLFFEKIKIEKIHLFFILYFSSQLLGLYLNEERIFNAYNSYLPILALGSIFLFSLCNHTGANNLIKYFFTICILFLIAVFVLVLVFKFPEMTNLNFYKAFANHDNNFLGNANPRITGLSRMLAIINLFFILYFFKLNNFYLKKILITLLIIFSVILIFMQSRGTLVCYFFTATIIILFLINKKNNFRVKYFLLLVALPIALYLFSNNNLISKNTEHSNAINTHNRIISTNLSGRFDIWSYTLNNHDYKKIFGYGANGDRFLLKKFDKKNRYGDNTSNILLYSLVSGGVASVVFLILIFAEIVKIFFQNKKYFFSYKNSFYVNFSIVCLIFFTVRSLFENSFGLFSTDFLIIYVSISYILVSVRGFEST